MKERGMLFSAPNIQPILAGDKTHTRRIMNPQPGCPPLPADMPFAYNCSFGAFVWNERERPPARISKHSPYGQPGDRIWVRETFWAYGRWHVRFSVKKGRNEWCFIDMTPDRGGKYLYEPPVTVIGKKRSESYPAWWKRNSLFMPRHASRILLEIIAIRVERLQDISAEDARAEGVLISDEWTGCADDLDGSYIKAYRFLWKNINGDGSWDANPYVWVFSFKRIEP